MVLAVPLVSIVRIVCLHLRHPYARATVKILEGSMLSYSDNDLPSRANSPKASTRGAPSVVGGYGSVNNKR